MSTDTRNLALYARLTDLHRRKTDAELTGLSTHTYDALIEVYLIELAEIEAAEQAKANAA